MDHNRKIRKINFEEKTKEPLSRVSVKIGRDI